MNNTNDPLLEIVIGHDWSSEDYLFIKECLELNNKKLNVWTLHHHLPYSYAACVKVLDALVENDVAIAAKSDEPIIIPDIEARDA